MVPCGMEMYKSQREKGSKRRNFWNCEFDDG